MSAREPASDGPTHIQQELERPVLLPPSSTAGEFPSVHSYSHFARSVSQKWRYTRDAEQQAFLEAVLATSATRRETIQAGVHLWRAQRGCKWPSDKEAEKTHDYGPGPLRSTRMKPQLDRASEGRANPRGIPYLYAAIHSDEDVARDTAIAEVRPWVGAFVSVATLQVARPLTIVNCTSEDRRNLIYFPDTPEPDAAEREKACWAEIDHAFARPVDRNDQLADYAPTQVIAEMFRQADLDGIVYRSSLGDGFNIVLFDLDSAHVVRGQLFEIRRGIKFNIEEAANPYYCMEPDPTVEVSNYIAAIHPAQNPPASPNE